MVHHIVMWNFKEEVEAVKKPELKSAMEVNLKSLVRLKQYLYNNVDLKEIIIATNFNLSGELMAEKIMNLIKDNNKLIVYRIGFGLPLNSALDYADNETIKYALLNKNKLKG